MDPTAARAILPTVSTVLVVATGAVVTRALHAGVPAGLVTAVVTVVAGLLTAAAVVVRRRRTARRRDDLDLAWAAVEPRWRAGSGHPER